MTYVMSDLHGCRREFHQMLKQINFSPEDHLYILGDVIDRGLNSINLLLDVITMENVTMLIGNHELWMQCVLLWGEDNHRIKAEWFDNGGRQTWADYRLRSREEKTSIIALLKNLPDYLEITVGSRDFYLVHGYPGNDFMERVWGRPKKDVSPPIPGKTVIIGHTPTPFLDASQIGGECKIVHLPGVIDIDCGSVCCSNGRLACLRLDDMAEFYVDVDR